MSAGAILADRLVALIAREVALREQARQVELDPNRSREAARLFARAGMLRAERLAELRCLGLL